MKKHELKTDPDTFDEVVGKTKSFEIRFDDRGYQVGDHLRLRKTRDTGEEMKGGMPLTFTGDETTREVSQILRGPIYGLKAGWVIMSIKDIDPTKEEVDEVMETLKEFAGSPVGKPVLEAIVAGMRSPI
jgi:hypothetical protein